MYTLGFFYGEACFAIPRSFSKVGYHKNQLMKSKLVILLISIISLLTFPQSAYSDHTEEKKAGSSAAFINSYTELRDDSRPRVLKGFLEKYNSPLANYAPVLVKEADENKLDWRLVAAILGVESTFANEMPLNSYNAWGWGIYGDNMYYFQSYPDAIRVISKSLREDYINKWGAEDIYQMGRIYAASPTWAQRVNYFVRKIDNYKLENPGDTLSLTL